MKSHCFHDLTDKLTVVLCFLITGSFTSVFFWCLFFLSLLFYLSCCCFSLSFLFLFLFFCFGKCTNHVLIVVSSARDLITSQSLCGACGLIGCCTSGPIGCYICCALVYDILPPRREVPESDARRGSKSICALLV